MGVESILTPFMQQAELCKLVNCSSYRTWDCRPADKAMTSRSLGTEPFWWLPWTGTVGREQRGEQGGQARYGRAFARPSELLCPGRLAAGRASVAACWAGIA
jgi:hypothetical protein